MIKNSKKIRGGELLAKALVEKGIEDVFTLAGGFCNPALEGFMNLQTNVVNCPHEQIAGHLADGLTRMDGSGIIDVMDIINLSNMILGF